LTGPLGNFALDGREFAGLVDGERVLELPFASTADVLSRWDANRERLDALADGPEHGLAALQVLPPVRPRQILQAAANYRKHVIDLVVALGQESREEAERMMDVRVASGKPFIFCGLVSSICGPFDDIVLPDEGEQHDAFEGTGRTAGKPSLPVDA
jgi:2-keto-4-pentenoate hydratase/2-oxohepta-3-ene-1,7-dioic acid hydratase in catechol pathway